MKLYGEFMPAPNPRRVAMFLAEKGVEIPWERIKMRERGHKAPDFLTKNSLGQLPVLELDDGTIISETISICRYLESLYPDQPLFGRNPLDAAMVDMWIRRVEFQLNYPIGQVWRNCHPLTAAIVEQIPAFGEQSREQARRAFLWLDGEMARKTWIAGEAFSMADIVALCAIDFGKFIEVEMPDACIALKAWYERVNARPSASAYVSISNG